ncbi:hypothetical protein ACO2RV_16260 [Ancylobacter sp. VNQ12]|uniref:hypothetical protein n=1 Tax=Ancylobacter sp. VNQ12 TaxID=3400920 RepID=UPI003C0EB73F
MEKHEPSLEEARSGDEIAPTQAADSPAVAHHAGPRPAAPHRAKGPPQEPEAFRRWIDIERLKVDMRRLDVETKRMEIEAQRPSAPAAPAPRATHPLLAAVLGAVAALLIVLPGFGLYQVLSLRAELGTLRTQIEELRGAVAAVDDKAAIAAEAASGPARVAALPQSETAPPAASAPIAPTSVATVPVAPTPAASEPPSAAAAPAAAPEPPAKPAGLGAGYIVRMFAPTGSVPAAKVEQFTGILKSAGFEVLVSDAGVSNPTSNTLSYNAASADVANKLATLVQNKRPALDLELRTSPSIPDSAKQILILNMTEDALR